MEVQAIARISGAPGTREPGEKFKVSAVLGEQLIARNLAVAVRGERKVAAEAVPVQVPEDGAS